MQGTPISQLNVGVQLYSQSLVEDPMSAHGAFLCVIAFGDKALQLEFMPVNEFAKQFDLTSSGGAASGGAALGHAVRALNTSLQQNLVLPQ